MRAALCIVLAAAQPPESVLRKRVAAEYVYVYENGGGQRTNGPPDKWPGQCKAPWLMTEELAVCCAGRCAEFCHEPCTGIGGFHVSNPPSLFDLSLIHISEPTRPY